MIGTQRETGPASAEHLAARGWLASNLGELAGYEGEWVELANGRVVVHGPSSSEAEHDARAKGYDDSLLAPAMPYPIPVVDGREGRSGR